MKTRFSAFVLLTAALAMLPSVVAAPAGAPADVVRVKTVKSWTGDQISRGDSPYSVRRSLGSPHQTLSADVWVYRGYYPTDDSVPDFRGHTLLVTFARNKVSELHLVNPRAERIYAAHLRTEKATLTIADIAKPAASFLP